MGISLVLMGTWIGSIGTILWGRKTYDFAVKMGGVGVYGKVKHFAFSRQPPSDPLPGVDFVSESILEFVGKLQAAPGSSRRSWTQARSTNSRSTLSP
jgi:hypothetical protein